MKKNSIILVFTFGLLSFLIFSIQIRKIYFSPVTDKNQIFIVDKKITYSKLLNKLINEFSIPSYSCFSFFCNKKNLKKFKSGKYIFKSGSSLNDIINELRVPENRKTIDFSFNSFDDLSYLASKLSYDTSIDSIILLNTIHSFNFDSVFNRTITKKEIISFFIPNTYNIYWHISEKQFIQRMLNEYQKFWAKRNKELNKLNLSSFQVSILASIVEKESNNISEMPDIASLYLNRLRRNMKLQADPTVNYCFKKLFDFDTTLTRVYKKHTKIICEYNTYLNKGLPPGPITSPSVHSIDAVLMNKYTNHLYMCAKAKINEVKNRVCFFDSHNFASSYLNHLKNARKYQKAMDKYKNGFEICFPDRSNCNCN